MNQSILRISYDQKVRGGGLRKPAASLENQSDAAALDYNRPTLGGGNSVLPYSNELSKTTMQLSVYNQVCIKLFLPA